MAERSIFWTTGTTGDGTNPISEAITTEWHRSLMTPRSGSTNAPNTTQGILRGVLNELAITGAASPISVAAGAAVVAGYYYMNDAALNVVVPTPAANTRIDRIVLRASHGTTRTVRITRIAGTEGTGLPPALTQSAGTTWDIALARVTITTGGVISIVDDRTLAQFATNHVKRDGDTMTGDLTVGTGDGAPSVVLDGAAGQLRRVSYRTNGVARWEVRASAVAESGGDAGSNFEIIRLNDAGGGASIAFRILRSTGQLFATGAFEILNAGNMDLRVVTGWLADLAVTTGKIADSAVTAVKLAANAVTTAKIADLNVTTAKIANLAVTEALIAGSAVTEGKIGSLAVTNAKVAANAITTVNIANLAVTEAKLGSFAVTTAKINDGAVNAAKIENLAVIEDKVASNAITLAKLAHPPRRQGGSSTNWNTPGTTNYTPATMRMQFGEVDVTFTGTALETTVNISWPVAYTSTPLIFLSTTLGTVTNPSAASVDFRSSTSAVITVRRPVGASSGSLGLSWLAIGPA
jgi:hypothetical protein